MELKKGKLLQNGKYRIEGVLGQGGFGITYLAVQVGLNRKVAVKEFYMKEHCNRDADTSFVSVPSVGSRELVDGFKNKFVKELCTLQRGEIFADGFLELVRFPYQRLDYMASHNQGLLLARQYQGCACLWY